MTFTTNHKKAVHVLGCLFLVYLSWGSSFIGIKFAIESFPAFLMCGLRMTLASILLYLFTWLKGERELPTFKDIRQYFVLAVFMVLISSGFLSKGQESVASGTAAMVLGSVPVWMVLAGWLVFHEPRPSIKQFIGLAGGFTGLVLLGAHHGNDGETSLWGLLLVVLAALGWVVGSFYSKIRHTGSKLSVMRGTAVLMFLGGIQSLAAALVTGEFTGFHPSQVSMTSLTALIYLVVAGAIIGYTCYIWLLFHTRTAVAVSYEYVNPVIGVFLGWFLANETVDPVIITACCLTVSSVFFVVSKPKKDLGKPQGPKNGMPELRPAKN